VWIGPRDHKLVGKELRACRLSAKIRQDDLAARLKKPQSFVSSYETGQRRIDLLEFLEIARAIGADPRKLFGRIAGLAQPKKVKSAKPAKRRPA
jgi:transcriptional regulator with XRE-family HTH domain